MIPRTVTIRQNWNITVWEYAQPAALVEDYWEDPSQKLDPFGLVAWPGAVVAARELQGYKEVSDQTVLILGGGVGIEAQAAAQLGAKVIATDIHPETQELLQYGAQQAGLSIETQLLDFCSDQPLPSCDVMVAADVLYNDKLAQLVVERCAQAYQMGATVLVTDSQRFVHGFDQDLSRLLGIQCHWEPRKIDSFQGSGILVDADQTYDVDTRIMWIKQPTSNDKEDLK